MKIFSQQFNFRLAKQAFKYQIINRQNLQVLNGRVVYVDTAKPRTGSDGGMPIARGPPEPAAGHWLNSYMKMFASKILGWTGRKNYMPKILVRFTNYRSGFYDLIWGNNQTRYSDIREFILLIYALQDPVWGFLQQKWSPSFVALYWDLVQCRYIKNNRVLFLLVVFIC